MLLQLLAASSFLGVLGVRVSAGFFFKMTQGIFGGRWNPWLKAVFEAVVRSRLMAGVPAGARICFRRVCNVTLLDVQASSKNLAREEVAMLSLRESLYLRGGA